jgi:glutamate synthase (NADPH/NADH) small chain
MDFLSAQNRRCSGGLTKSNGAVTAKDKVVVVIGGGDTGSDCVGTARRQGAEKIFQLEILPKPPEARPPDTPWPMWPRIMRTSSSHEEGCDRRWGVMTKKFEGGNTGLSQLSGCEVEWIKQDSDWKIKELAGTEFTLEADLAILAMGFVHIVHEGLVNDLCLELDKRGNITIKDYQTSEPWVFAAGDSANGASLVVTAIDSGRRAAEAMNQWLK